MASVTDAEGYFRSLIKFVSFYKSDKTTYKYIENVKLGVEKSSFINDWFLYKVLTVCKSAVVTNIKKIILNQCRGRFSILIDTATDVSASQQLSFIIRYTTDNLNIHEKLFSFCSVVSSTGLCLFNRLKEILIELDLNIKDAIGSSTDGASNMSGIHNSFSASMQKCNPNHIYTWCAAHRFNLVMDGAIKGCEPIISLLSSINLFNTIIRSSPKRVTEWTNIVTMLASKYKDISRRAMPQAYNSTRWWSKLKSISSMCSSVSSSVSFVLSLRKLYNLTSKKRGPFSASRNQEIKQLYDMWTQDRVNIVFARVLFIILQEMDATHTQLQLSALPISDMIKIMYSCINYINKIYNDDEIEKLVNNGCSFAESVSIRLHCDEVQELVSNGAESGCVGKMHLQITARQKDLITKNVKNFLNLIRKDLDNRFMKNFEKFNAFYSEVARFHPSSVLEAHQNSSIKFEYLAKYNDLEESELMLEYKVFANEIQKIVQRGKWQKTNQFQNKHLKNVVK